MDLFQSIGAVCGDLALLWLLVDWWMQHRKH